MHNCLVEICKEFEKLKGFLNNPTKEQEEIVNRLFKSFMECFPTIKEEKLEYPSEFIEDIRLFNEGHELVNKKFEDIQIRYLMLSDFYDFVRVTKKYKKI
ncbi:hypothetical protein CRV08_04995 [Halarcobacter ebronensis]|uniref:Uncharacterized protein n=1 Tax=Halarcobacter ebronensis TaxID=1462615 RepID=A0A4Q0YFN0_9BACT|nr:hypothetical protein [Halarcobacter ebronensis]RXJ69362.1 hypothetical protein CRV08_04995 [Halarcobacter ebronensis]